MFPYSTNSMYANPAHGAAFASLGLKPRKSAITFSVGTQAVSPDDYITKTKAGALPTATINDGYITFSVPQSHPYVGVGDKVILDIGGDPVTVYLNEKVSTRRWKVFNQFGNTPNDVLDALEVSIIDKTFSGLRDAIDGDTPGAWDLLGGTYNLIYKNAMLQIACYEMVDDMGSNHVTISPSWFQDTDRRIRIFTPTNITYECNKSQRHKNGRADQGGYRVKTTDTSMIDLFEFTIVEGLILGDDVANPTNGIVCGNSNYDEFQILNNVFYNIGNAVNLTSSGNNYIIANNVVRDGTNGLVLNSCDEGGACFNNTVINCSGDGISYTTNNLIDIINNIMQDCGTDLNDNAAGKTNVFNCISSDGSVGSSQDNVSNVSLKFEDKTNKDYRLHHSDTDAYLSDAGQDLSDNDRYPFEHDANGMPIDDSWCIGAFHHEREVAYALGPTSIDLNTASTFSITDSEMLFNTAQTHELLSAGCVVDDGSSTYLLKRKLADDRWLVTTFTGGVVADDAGPTPVSSINFKANNLYEIMNQSGTRIYNIIGTLRLWEVDLRVKVLCVAGSGHRKCDIYYSSREPSRNMMVYAPTGPGIEYVESNTNRRNNGKWDTLDYISSSTDFPVNTPYTQYGDEDYAPAIDIDSSYCVVDGLQVSSSTVGINIVGEENCRITNNYIKECKNAGIQVGGFQWDPWSPTTQNIIANNTVIKCGGGIEVVHGIEYISHAGFVVGEEDKRFIIGPNSDVDINHIIRKYTYKVVVSSENKIEWFPGRVVITVDSGDNMQDVLDSGNVSGVPWGTLNVYFGESDPLTAISEIRIGDVPNVGNPGVEKNGISFIYANTVIKCERGILIDTLPVEEAFTNVAIIRSNLVSGCTYDNYYSSSRWPKTVLAEYNWSDDQSINNFFGQNNVDSSSIRFVEPESDDYRLTLYDTERMVGLNLASDEFRQIQYDNVGTDYESLPFWSIGANCWKYRNKEIHASIGDESGDLCPSVTDVKVENGILEFTGTVGNIGIGDRVNYDDGGATYCYLAERGTDNRWLAVDASGDPLPDMTDKTVTSVNRVSNSLETALSTDITTEFSDISDKDIVADLLNLFLWCYDDNDAVDEVTNVQITGWNQNFFYRLYIQTPWDIQTQCITKQRHEGVWGGYRVNSDTDSVNTIDILDDYTVIRGLSVRHYDEVATAAGSCIYGANGLTGLIVEHNIIRDVSTGYGIRLDGASASSRNYAINNIVYGCEVGIWISHAHAMRNTVYQCGDGIESNNATDFMESNACNYMTSPSTCFVGPGAQRANISSDISATGPGSISQERLKFANIGVSDFHLNRNDWQAVNRGINHGAARLPKLVSGEIVEYPSYRDIDMEIIEPDKCCIGADSIADIETIDLYFSVAYGDTTNYRTGTSPTVTVDGGIATFSEPQTNPNIGVGDKIDIDIDGVSLHLVEKISDTQWRVVSKEGFSPSGFVDLDLVSIERAFSVSLTDLFNEVSPNSLQWFLANISSDTPFYYLRTSRYRLNLSFYQHTSDNPHTVVRYFDTGPNDYIRFFTPNNLDVDCNSGQSHNGVRGDTDPKAIIASTTSSPAISLYVPHTVIDGMILNGNHSDDAPALALYNTHGCKFVNNLMPEPYIGIDTRDRGHDDPDGDDFEGGIRQGGFWEPGFQNDWEDRVIPGVGTVAVPEWPSAGVAKNLTSPSSMKSGDFDYEVNVVLGSNNEIGDDLHFSLVDGGGTQAELIWKGGLEVIEFNSTQLKFPWVLNREYKFRIVRGGDITSDGLYEDNPAKDDVTTLYYFDDFNDGGGTGTHTWIEFPTTYTAWSGAFWITVKAPKWHGFNSIFLWNTGDSTPAKNIGRNADNVIANNTVYNAETQGIVSTGSDLLYNNTVDEAGDYCYYNQETDVFINNIGNRAITSDYKEGATAEYCLAGDSSLVVDDYNNNINGQVLDFINKVSAPELRDYHLNITDGQAIWTGARLDWNIDYPFDFDGGRTKRMRKWDRGALEYQSNKIVYSVGYGVDDYKTQPLVGALDYTIEDVNGRNVLTFSIPQTHPGLGVGCEIIDTSQPFPNGCVLVEKINTSKWIVTDFQGNSIGTKESEVNVIRRVFSNLTDALTLFKSSPYVGADLETAGAFVIFACYDDSLVGPPFVQTAKLDGCGGGKHHNIKIMTPYNLETECNESQRHEGVYGDGYSFDPFILSAEENAAIFINQHSYFEIEGLQISSTLNDASGIHLYDCQNSYIGYNIIHDLDGHGILHEPITNPTDEIINNSIYDCKFDGIMVKVQQWEFFSVAVYINNNTIFRCRRGVHVDKPDYHFPAGLIVEVNNTIATDSRYQDFVSQYENNFGRVVLNSCISGDPSAFLFPGLNNMRSVYVSFISRENKNFNLSKLKDGFAVDSAIDFSTDYLHPFIDDIHNEMRDPGEFDRGAFEVIELLGTGEMAIGPIVTNSQIGIESLIFPTTILYLREPGPGGETDNANFLSHIDPFYQFTTIEGADPDWNINAFLAIYAKTDNIIIYVHGGKTFGGMFELQDRNPRTVRIETYPPETYLGPAAHAYNGYIVDTVSKQGILLYRNMKVHEKPEEGYGYIISNSADTALLRFENCIVQVNLDTIVNNADCLVQTIHTIVVYRYGAGGAVR